VVEALLKLGVSAKTKSKDGTKTALDVAAGADVRAALMAAVDKGL